MRPAAWASANDSSLGALLAGSDALLGEYFDNANFTGASFTRSDANVGFDWQARAPLTRMGVDTFSVRWTGQIRTTVAGTYGFRVDADGTAALRVRGKGVALTPTAGGAVGTIALPANQVVDLKLDYVHITGNARVALAWTPPGQASATPIPTDRMLNTFAPPAETFANPIIGTGADPWVIQVNDEYVYVWSDGGRIYGSRSPLLHGIGAAAPVILWTAPASGPNSRNIWAPELHRIDNKWHLYFAADDGNNANHRMYVATRTLENPLGAFSGAVKIAPTTDRWAIDGTVLEHNGSRYFIWSGWDGFSDGQQNLYIAAMSSPTTISGDRTLIATPDADWERHGLPINEGPTVLKEGGQVHVIYSGSGYWTKQYALGDLVLVGANPLQRSAWSKNPSPVFSQANGVTGVGHASFVKSPDETEDWIVYHAHRDANTFNEDRVVRVQPFTFNGTTPIFGQPVADATPINVAAGTPTLVTVPFAVVAMRAPADAARTRASGLLQSRPKTPRDDVLS